jgi:hypothetical protein
MGAMPSPLTGHSGNVEFLLYARSPVPAGPSSDRGTRTSGAPDGTGPMLDDAVAEAHGRGAGPTLTDPGA